jgi:hypothetical protein
LCPSSRRIGQGPEVGNPGPQEGSRRVRRMAVPDREGGSPRQRGMEELIQRKARDVTPAPAGKGVGFCLQTVKKSTYLFTDESGGTYSRTQLFFIPGAGQPFSGPGRLSSGTRDGLPPEPGTAFRRGPDGLPQGPGRPSARVKPAFLQVQSGLPPGQSCLPPAPGQATSLARATDP